MTFMQELKSKFKWVLGISLVAAVLSQLIIPAAISQADGPRFNFLEGDYKLLRGADISENEDVWKNDVTGKPGDTFEGLIYYHNGKVDTVAKNTTIKVSIPTETINGRTLIGASISAENAETVSDTMGVVLSEDADLEFVPGSVIWYPNQNENPGTPSPLPFGQSGSEIVSAGGLNIGDIQGCWNFAGFVKFRFKAVKKVLPPEITKSKIAKNLTTGVEGTDIAANPGDRIQYTLTTKNIGGSDAPVVVKDDLSDILEYATLEAVDDGGILAQNQISWPAAVLAPGVILKHTFVVKIANPLPNMPRAGYHFDFIMYNVYGNEVFVRLPKPVPGQPCLTIAKTVRNYTAGETTFVDANEANAGDTLEYKVDFANTGDGDADGAVLSDTLPVNVIFLPGTTIISTNDGIERTYIDGINQNGLVLNIPAKSHGYIKFKVATSASIAGGETLVNTAYLKLGDKVISDIATTKIRSAVVPPQNPITPELPKTGAENVLLVFFMTAATSVFVVYLQYKKKLERISLGF